MSRRLRELALAAAGGLMLLAPAATASATSIRNQSVHSVTVPPNAQMLLFRETKARQITLYDARVPSGQPTDQPGVTRITDPASLYYGKLVAI